MRALSTYLTIKFRLRGWCVRSDFLEKTHNIVESNVATDTVHR